MTAEQTSVKVPRVLWAQDRENVFVTIEIVEAEKESVDIQENTMTFSGVDNTGSKYEMSLEFYASVSTTDIVQNKSARNIFFTIKKADSDKPFWPRLVKSGKPHFVHTDFNRWKEEGESEEESEMPSGMGGMGGMGGGMGDFDMSQFANMAGKGGFPGFAGNEDDDEEEDGEEAEGREEVEDVVEDPYQKAKKIEMDN